MAVRTDKIQITIDFITDESKALAKAITSVDTLKRSIAENQKAIADYDKELKKTNLTEERRTQILRQKAEAERLVNQAMKDIVSSGKAVEKLDLTKVAPAQLIQRANQLAQAMRNIPASTPEFKALEAELARVNGQLATLRANARGIQVDGDAASPGVGGFFGSVVGKVAVAVAAVQAFFATVQGLFNFARTAVAEFRADAQAEAALASRIQSTDGAAGRTVEQLVEQAKELQKVTFFTDEQTAKGQEILLTFTNIRGEIFDRTIPAAQDLSTVFGQDLQSSAVQLGKALNDPVQGITALRRVGVTFSDDQQRLIKRLVDTNQVAEAQRVILSEVERQVGGAARAAAEAEGGGYRLLQQRLGEVQEGFGGLISQGLDRLQPAFEVVVTVLEKVVGALTSGTTATGEYSGVANFLVGIVKVLGFAFNTLGTVLGFVFRVFNTIAEYVVTDVAPAFDAIGRGISAFIANAQRIPVVGTLIRGVADMVGLLRDAIANLPATLAGFRAAAQQAVENVSRFFSNLVLSAKILAKELELALTIRSEARAELLTDISNLRQQQAAAQAAGKSIGEAYTEARNKALAEGNKQAAAEERRTLPARPVAPDDDLSVGGTTPEDAAKRRKAILDADLKEVEAAALRREVILENQRLKDEVSEQQYQQSLLDIRKQKLQEQLAVYRKFKQEESVEALKIANDIVRIETESRKRIQEQGLNSDLQNIEQVSLRRQTVLEGQRIRDEVSEQQYQERITELKRLKLEEQLAVYRKFGQDQTTEALKVQNELSRIEAETAQRSREEQLRIRLEVVQADRDGLLTGLREKFSQALITEQDYNLQKLEIQRLALEAELAILRESAPTEVEEIKKREEAKAKVEDEIAKKRLENEERTEALRRNIQRAGMQATQDLFQVAADLLSQDEATRKKNASAIKAFQSAQVIVQGIAEVQKIWAGAAELGPIAGPIIGAIQTAVAVARTGIALKKIQAAKFAGGGFTGMGIGARDDTGYKPAGVVHEGEYVVPKWIVDNPNFSPVIRWLESRRLRGFADGGFASINTNPTVAALPSVGASQAINIGQIEMLDAAVRRFERVVADFPKEVKSRVVYQDVEEAGQVLNAVRDEASL